jgi:hypothetical protein
MAREIGVIQPGSGIQAFTNGRATSFLYSETDELTKVL